MPLEPTPAGDRPLIVLDTNVVLDWLVFDDACGREVGRAIAEREFVWIATPAMRDEQFEVLGRKALERWRPDGAAVRRAWDAHCRMKDAPQGRIGTVRSADPDDQMFVDLALGEGARCLLSRDRALLDLAVALRPHSVEVMTPAVWTASRRSRTA